MAERILAIDYGLTRVGLAISDPLGVTGHPLATLERRGDKHICREVAEIVAQRGVGEIVVGLPKELSGELGPAARQVLAFVDRLARYVTVPIATWDERLTTAEAQRTLLHTRRRRRAQREEVIDQIAASLILQGYLTWKSGTEDA